MYGTRISRITFSRDADLANDTFSRNARKRFDQPLHGLDGPLQTGLREARCDRSTVGLLLVSSPW